MFFKKTDIEQLSECATVGGNISLEPLLAYLEKILYTKGEERQLIPRFCLETIRSVEQNHGRISEVNLEAYEEVFQMIYSLQGGLHLDEKGLWALGYPVPHQVFYGTTSFYDFLGAEPQLAALDRETNLTSIQQLLYGIILERFYGMPNDPGKLLYKVGHPGLERYYELQVDFSFVDIKRHGELPIIDLTPLRDKEDYCLADLIPIFEALNMENFTFEGFTILTFADKTIASLAERLQRLTADLPQYDHKEHFFFELNHILTIAAGSPGISASLVPVLELNGYPILSTDFARNSIFFQELKKRNAAGQIIPAMAAYLEKPHPILYGIEKSLDTADDAFREFIRKYELASYINIPLKQHGNLVGFFEIYSYQTQKLNKTSVVPWKILIPSLTHLASEIVSIFKNSLERTILNNFTSLNPAVEWRFNEVAAQHIASYMRREPEQSMAKVRFEKVYPIYGAIDVKDSTRLRSKIYRKDNLFKTTHLEGFLRSLPADTENALIARLGERAKQVRTWLESKDYERFLLDIFLFLHEELFELMEEMKQELPLNKSAIENFMDKQKNIGGGRTDIFETSLQQLNDLIKEEVKYFNDAVQDIFPSYFEMFRSDGIEYDMYVGQSITPTKIFHPSLLREIRKQQLISMARIGKRAAKASDSLAVPMQVTLLIFVHASAIDISFREDERRFDVEGGYNIRYQMVKKRIDKVLIQGSNERLVRPNTLAIVFQGEALEPEIKDLLTDVAAMGLLAPDFEFCNLEEIQGVNELRAVRTPIVLEEG